MDIRRTGQIKQGERLVGHSTRVRVVKNKMAPPFRTAEFDMMFGRGVSWEGELVDLGVQCGVIKKAGAWLSIEAEVAPAAAWKLDEATEATDTETSDGDSSDSESNFSAVPSKADAANKAKDAAGEATMESDADAVPPSPATSSSTSTGSSGGYSAPEGTVMIGQGREKAKVWVSKHPAVSAALAEQVKI